MTVHQQDYKPDEVVSSERIATRIHSWLLIMCLGYPVVLVGLLLISPMLALDFVATGICQLIGTLFPVALMLILINMRKEDSVPISWVLIIAPAVWIAAISWFYWWFMMGLATSF